MQGQKCVLGGGTAHLRRRTGEAKRTPKPKPKSSARPGPFPLSPHYTHTSRARPCVTTRPPQPQASTVFAGPGRANILARNTPPAMVPSRFGSAHCLAPPPAGGPIRRQRGKVQRQYNVWGGVCEGQDGSKCSTQTVPLPLGISFVCDNGLHASHSNMHMRMHAYLFDVPLQRKTALHTDMRVQAQPRTQPRIVRPQGQRLWPR